MEIKDKHKLRNYQIEHFNRVLKILDHHHAYLDTSEPGAGKTHIPVQIALNRKMSVLVICPKSMVHKWKHILNKYGVNCIDVLTYASLRGTEKHPPKHGYLKLKNGKYTATPKFNKLVTQKLLLVFDESHNIKNKNSQFSASFALVKALINLSNENIFSKIALLSATPGNEKEHTGNILKLMGFTIKDKLYSYNRSDKKYYLVGLEDVIQKCLKLDSETTTFIICRPINRSTINTISHLLFTNIIKQHCTSEMVVPENNLRKRDAKDGFYIMDNTDVELIKKGIGLLTSAVKYEHHSGRVNFDKGCWGNITTALMIIESGKLNTMVRLCKEKLINDPNCKVVLYFNYIKNMKAAYNILSSYNPLYMDGQTNSIHRKNIIKLFQHDSNNYRILISNPKVGGIGVDLDDIYGNHKRYLFQIPTYNYIDSHQSACRIYRSNTKSLATIRFVYSKKFPFETSILNAIIRKRNIVRDIITDDKNKVILPGEYEIEIEGDTSDFDKNFYTDLSIYSNYSNNSSNDNFNILLSNNNNLVSTKKLFPSSLPSNYYLKHTNNLQ